MEKKFFVLIFTIFLTLIFYRADGQEKEKPKVVRNTFATGILIDNQTIASPYKGGLELEIQHRFSLIKNYHDIFGIYNSANTRLGLNYGITDRLMVGLGTTKDYKLQDLQWKYLILQQTETNSTCFSLSYYGNIIANLSSSDEFGPTESFREIHRFSYFTQVILARKFSDLLSLQVAPSFIYYNAVPTGYKNINAAISSGAQVNLFGSHSVIFEYDQLLTKQDIATQPKPNLSAGWEISTTTHCFQVFVANYDQIVYQRNLLFNTNDFAKGEYLFGFNITVRF